MENDFTHTISWWEPSWSLRSGQETIRSVLFCRQMGRLFALIITAGILFLACLLSMKVSRNLIMSFICVFALINASILGLGMLKVVLQFVTPATKILVQKRRVIKGSINFSREVGDQLSIEQDDQGHNWLVILREAKTYRVGIAEHIEVNSINMLLL